MIRYHLLTAVAILLLSTGRFAPAAVTPPPAPPETPAARAFRLAGFTEFKGGCRIQFSIYKAGTTVGDAQLKDLVDPGAQFNLDVSNSRVTDAGMKDLAKLSNVLQLTVSGTSVTLAGLAELGNRRLVVNLNASQITAESVRYLSEHAKPTFSLNVQPIDDTVFHTLSEAHLVHLLTAARQSSVGTANSDQAIDSLILQTKGITDASMKDVASLVNFSELYLGYSGVTDAGISKLTGLRHLSRLDVNNTRITDASLQSIAALENLHTVTIAQTAITGTGLKYLAHHAGLSISLDESQLDPQTLREIARDGIPTWTLLTKATDRSIRALSEAGMLHLLYVAHSSGRSRPQSADDVTYFGVNDKGVGDAGLKELSIFKNLQELDLRFSQATDATVQALVKLDHLTSLDAGYTQITDAGLKLLAGKKNLATLNVSNTRVTAAGVRELQLALPGCAIER